MRPKNLYGVTKVFGEALGSYISDTSDLSIIAVRIANVAHFSCGERHSARDVSAYIGVRDVVQLLMVSVQSGVAGFTIVNGVSDNRYKRLSIERSRNVHQYQVGPDSTGQRQRFHPGKSLGYDVEMRYHFQPRAQVIAYHWLAVDQDNSDGTTAAGRHIVLPSRR